MIKQVRQTHDRATQYLPMQWCLLVALFLQGFLLNAQTVAPTAERLRLACEDLSIEPGFIYRNCESATACFQVSGGSPPYTVVLNAGPNTPPIPSNPNYCFVNLPYGQYVVTVADAEGCTTSIEFNLEIDGNFDAEITHVSCHGGSDGRIDPVIPADLSPAHFHWEASNGFQSDEEIIEGISAGVYYLVLRNAENECIAFSRWIIEAPAPIGMDVSVNLEPCELASACVSVSGGTAPYTVVAYSILPPQLVGTTSGQIIGFDLPDGIVFGPTLTDPSFCADGLPNGTYYVVVVDANGCYRWDDVQIQNTATFTRQREIRRVSCHGGQDGRICFGISGGIEPFSTTLSPPGMNVGITTRQGCFENLSAGVYTLTTIDGSGCLLSENVVVRQPDVLTATFNRTNSNCDAGGADGCLTIAGGTPGYEVSLWQFPSPGPTVIPQVVFTGAQVSVTGGTRVEGVPFMPANSTGNVRCAQNIPPGIYYILVVDSRSCYTLVPVTISPSSGLELSADVRNVGCNGQESRIKLTIQGGTAPYFIYRNANTQPAVVQTNMYVVEGLEPGTYTFVVYDNFQCSATITVVIGQSGELDLNLDFDPFGEEACVNPAGGTAPYMIRWYNLNSNIPIGDDPCVHNLAPGAYRVVAIDAGGCETEAIFFIDEQPCSGGEASVEPAVIESGQSTTLFLHNWSGVSIQWQFRTELTGWLNIPGGNTAIYHTPAMHSAVDRIIYVRAVVACDGAVYLSEPSQFTILGSNLLPPWDGALDAYLFDAGYQAQLGASMMPLAATNAVAQVFPTLSPSESWVRFTADVSGVVRITLVSSMGAAVYQTTLTNPLAGEQVALPLTDLQQGAYFVRIGYGLGVQTERIIVVR